MIYHYHCLLRCLLCLYLLFAVVQTHLPFVRRSERRCSHDSFLSFSVADRPESHTVPQPQQRHLLFLMLSKLIPTAAAASYRESLEPSAGSVPAASKRLCGFLLPDNTHCKEPLIRGTYNRSARNIKIIDGVERCASCYSADRRAKKKRAATAALPIRIPTSADADAALASQYATRQFCMQACIVFLPPSSSFPPQACFSIGSRRRTRSRSRISNSYV